MSNACRSACYFNLIHNGHSHVLVIDSVMNPMLGRALGVIHVHLVLSSSDSYSSKKVSIIQSLSKIQKDHCRAIAMEGTESFSSFLERLPTW